MGIWTLPEPQIFAVEREFFGWTLFGRQVKYHVRAWFKRVDDEEYAKGGMRTSDSKEFLILYWHDRNFNKTMEETGRFFLYTWIRRDSNSLQPSCDIYQFTDYEEAPALVRTMKALGFTQDFTEYPDKVPTIVCDYNCVGLGQELTNKAFRLNGCELQGPVRIQILPPDKETLDENIRRMGEDTFMELKSALADLLVRENAVIAAYHEIHQIKKRHLEREWIGDPGSPLRVKTRSIEDGIEISWSWQWNSGLGTVTLLGFRSEGGFSQNDYKENEGTRIVDSENPSGSTVDYLQPEKTYYYKFYLRRVIYRIFAQDYATEWRGLVKFSIRLPRPLQIPDPLTSTEEAYKIQAKVHRAGAEAIRARTQFEQEKQALEELLKPQQESSKEAKTVTASILHGLDEAFEREREREKWYGERLKEIADAVGTDITQEQAERLEQTLYDLHMRGNP